MGFYYFSLCFSITIVVVCIIATFCIIREEHKVTPTILTPLGFVIFFGIMTGVIIKDYNNTVSIKADEFLLTRKDAYACDTTLYNCKLQIMEWQQDSVYWQHKVNAIFKEK